MAYIFQQTNGAGSLAAAAFCSGLALNSATAVHTASVGGTPDSNNINASVQGLAADRATHFFQCTLPGGVDFGSGNWACEFHVGSNSVNLTLTSVHICLLNSSGVNYATIGSVSGLSLSWNPIGTILSVSVPGIAITPNAGDIVMVVLGLTNAAGIASACFITVDKTIVAPSVVILSKDPFYTPLNQPIFGKPPLPVGAYPFLVRDFNLTDFGPNPVDWLVPLSEPVRKTPPLSIGAYPFLFRDLGTTRFEPNPVDWFVQLSEPVRVRSPLPIGAYPSYFPDTTLFQTPVPPPPIFPPDSFVLSDTTVLFPIEDINSVLSNADISGFDYGFVLSDAAVTENVTNFVNSNTLIGVVSSSFVLSDTIVVAPGFGMFTGFSGS